MSSIPVKLWTFHSGSFERIPNLEYYGGKSMIIKTDPNCISSLTDLKKELGSRLGYHVDNIRSLYYALPNLPLDECLVEVTSDNVVGPLIVLAKTSKHVRLYLTHPPQVQNAEESEEDTVDSEEDTVENADKGVEGREKDGDEDRVEQPEEREEDTVESEEGTVENADKGVEGRGKDGDEDRVEQPDKGVEGREKDGEYRDEDRALEQPDGQQNKYIDEDEAVFLESDGENNSDYDDEDAINARRKMKTVFEKYNQTNVEDLEVELEGNDIFGPNEPPYHDSDDPSSPEDESDEDEGQKKKKKKRSGMYRYSEGTEFAAGAKFPDKKSFKLALDQYRITNGYNVHVGKSDKKRMQAKCMAEGCPWSCWASPLGNELTWVIKVMDKKHNCIPFSYEKGSRHITSDWLAKTYEQKIRQQPDMTVRAFKGVVDTDLDTDVSSTMCSNAKHKALKAIQGDYRAQFGMVRSYCHEVAKRNNGSNIKIRSGRNEREECVLKSLYMCLSSLKKGMLEGCRKVISLDGCFMKGPWKGQVLVAVGRDGNNQMYPFAWGVADRETSETWRFFVDQMSNDLEMGNGAGWTIISDQQKGLIDAIATLLPNAQHRLCARHVYANLRKHWRGEQYKLKFWKVAKASNQEHFTKFKKEFQELDATAWDFVERKGPEHFCRLFFSEDSKCDSVDNNMAEIFNATIVDARFKPIVSMLDDIYNQVMVRIANRQKWTETIETPVCPRILKKVQKNQAKSVYWRAQEAGNGIWGVRHGLEGFFVSLNHRTCSCGAWQLSGIPCVHAIAVFRDNKIVSHTYVHECFSTESLRKTYAHTVHPINGVDMWEDPPHGDPIVAPVFKDTKRGLKFKRTPEAGENKSRVGRVSMTGGNITCSNCSQVGHNKKTCPARTTNQPSSSRSRPQPTGTTPTPQPQPTPRPPTPQPQPTPRPPTPQPKPRQPTANMDSAYEEWLNMNVVEGQQVEGEQPTPLQVDMSVAHAQQPVKARTKLPFKRATQTNLGVRVMMPTQKKSKPASKKKSSTSASNKKKSSK